MCVCVCVCVCVDAHTHTHTHTHIHTFIQCIYLIGWRYVYMSLHAIHVPTRKHLPCRNLRRRNWLCNVWSLGNWHRNHFLQQHDRRDWSNEGTTSEHSSRLAPFPFIVERNGSGAELRQHRVQTLCCRV